MNVDLLQQLRLRRAESRNDLATCSICLRVHRGSEWMEAERVIRETRSYDFADPPRLASAVCDDCAETIFNRRALDEPVAA